MYWFFLNFLVFSSKGEWAGNISVYWKQLVSSTAVVYKTNNNYNVKLWPIFIYLTNYGDVHILIYCLMNFSYGGDASLSFHPKLYPLDRHYFYTASSWHCVNTAGAWSCESDCTRYFSHCCHMVSLVTFLGVRRLASDPCPGQLSIESYVHNLLYEVPTPLPGRSMCFSCPLADSVVIQRPGSIEELPLFDFSLRELFTLLGVDCLIQLFTCVLLEHQVLLCSSGNAGEGYRWLLVYTGFLRM